MLHNRLALSMLSVYQHGPLSTLHLITEFSDTMQLYALHLHWNEQKVVAINTQHSHGVELLQTIPDTPHPTKQSPKPDSSHSLFDMQAIAMKLEIVAQAKARESLITKAPEVSSRSAVKHVVHGDRLLNAESSW